MYNHKYQVSENCTIVQIHLENKFLELEFWAKEYTFVILTVISSFPFKGCTNLNFH